MKRLIMRVGLETASYQESQQNSWKPYLQENNAGGDGRLVTAGRGRQRGNEDSSHLTQANILGTQLQAEQDEQAGRDAQAAHDGPPA